MIATSMCTPLGIIGCPPACYRAHTMFPTGGPLGIMASPLHPSRGHAMNPRGCTLPWEPLRALNTCLDGTR